MRKFAVPQSRIPGASRQTDPDTFMPVFDKKGRPLWDMPKPIAVTDDGTPVYRGTSASYARWVKSQIRRNMQKQREAQAKVDALNEKEEHDV